MANANFHRKVDDAARAKQEKIQATTWFSREAWSITSKLRGLLQHGVHAE
jgi:hypothetical protein